MDAVYFTCQPCLLWSDTVYWQKHTITGQKSRKTTELNAAVAFVGHTNTQASDMGVKARKVHSFLWQASQQTHYYHTQTKSHTHTHKYRGVERPRIPRLVNVYLKTRGSCECSQVRLLCMYVGARKTLLTAVRHFDCPAWLLYPKPSNTPTSQHPPSQMAFFF